MELAKLYESSGQYRLAEEAYKELIAGFSSPLDSQSPLTLDCHDQLSLMLCKRGQYREAEATSRKALKARISSQGLGDRATLFSLANLILAVKQQGNSRAALSLFQDALESGSEMLLGETERASFLGHLATLLLECGMYDIAAFLSYTVMQSSISSNGQDELLSLNNMGDLATALNCQGYSAGAEMLYRRALQRLERVLGTDHPETLKTNRRLADTLRCQLRDQDCIRLLKASSKLQEKEYGESNLEISMMQTSLGAIYALKGLWNDAEEMMMQALDGYRESHDLDQKWTSWTEEILEIIRSVRDAQFKGLTIPYETKLKRLIEMTTPYLGPTLEADLLRYEDTDSPFTLSSDRAIIVAATNGDFDKIQANITNSKIIPRALRAAAANHQIEVVRLILDSGVSANVGGAFYGTPLQAAALSGDRPIIDLLMDRKANINHRGGVFGTALQAAILSRKATIVRHLIMLAGQDQIYQDTLDSALLTAVQVGEEECVVDLLNVHANINAADNLVGSALQQSCLRGRISMTKLLLKNGAKVDVRTGLFDSPLQIAVATRDEEMVEILFSSGADIRSLYPQLDSNIPKLQMAAYTMVLRDSLFQTMSNQHQTSQTTYSGDVWVVESRLSRKKQLPNQSKDGTRSSLEQRNFSITSDDTKPRNIPSKPKKKKVKQFASRIAIKSRPDHLISVVGHFRKKRSA